MLVIYATRTGNVRNFAKKLPFPTAELTSELVASEPFVLVTYTDGSGEVPPKVCDFLERGNNASFIHGIATSGNRNFEHFGWYGKAADTIAEKYGVPIVAKFELAGTPTDIRKFNEGVVALFTNTSN